MKKIGGILARNARFGAPTCLVSRLWFSRGLAVSMGEAAELVLLSCCQLWKLSEVSYEMLVFLHPRVLSRVAGFPVAWPCLWRKLENLSFSNVSKQVVMSFCVAGVALCDIPTSPHSTLYTPHFTLHTPHSILYTSHFTLHTPHSSLHTLHFTLLTPHFTLLTLHSTLLTPHFTLLALHSTLHTLHFTLLTPHSTLHTPHSTLHTLHFTLHTPHSTLYTPHSTLYTLYTPHFTLHTPYFRLRTPHSTLSTPHCRLVTRETCTRLFK